ncbi:hypothetical protein MOR33_004188 [Salmonella enterica]|nr:hypothetical protein [Salmonella enterica]EGG3070750.1 hypothetical protein [Salmonella enterica]EGL7476525.1 hypothetical protein [Salmonella enterica]EGL7480197.1 hypothetical protein [Salmonella enterica]EIZ2334644.1 hypothetical protein [Salmonella enterica]
MRSLLTGISLLALCFSAYSRDLDSAPVSVKRITAYWAATAPNTIYSYTFSGLDTPDSCGKNDEADAVSGDSNINRILQMAYSLNEKVKVGITSNCTITTVMLDTDY